MKSNHSSIRVRGQRLIQSTLIHRTPTNNDDQSRDCREKSGNASGTKKRPSISLSDFLNRKLKKTSHQSKFVQGKENPFLSPRTNLGTNQSIVGAKTDKKTKGPELNAILDVALEQFKCSKENDNNTFLNLQDENQTSTATMISQESQIQDFGGLYGKSLAPKGVVVLGGDPKPKQSRCEKPFIKGEKPLPVYNHYASGSGWWDSDMEGIDNDEVGFNEVWEGVGSATMGGLDWH